MTRRDIRLCRQGISAFAAFAAVCLSPAAGLAQPVQSGLAQISPDAGLPFPWEAGRRVSTYSSVNLFNGNVLTQIPITGWTLPGADFDFRLFHNSSAAADGFPAPPGSGFVFGAGWSTSYGGQLVFQDEDEILVVEDDGLVKLYTEDNGDWIPPTGVYDTLEYDEGIERWVLTRKNQTRREFDENGKLLAEYDSLQTADIGPELQRVDGLLDEIIAIQTCRKLEFDYDQNDRVQMITESPDGDGIADRRWWFEYDGEGWLESVTGPYQISESGQNGEPPQGAMVISITYDEDGRIETITDRENNIFEYTYDAYGRIHEVIDPEPYDDQIQEFLYTPTTTYKTQYFDRRGVEWVFVFNPWGGLDSMTNPLSDDVAFEYDADRNRTLFTDEEQNDWVSSYDSLGNRTSLTDPLGHRWEWTYDAYSNVTSITPPADDQGNVDEDKRIEIEYLHWYDEQQQIMADYTHPTKITEPADGEGNGAADTILEWYHNESTDGCWSRAGNLKRVTDANGVPTFFNYNGHQAALTDLIEGLEGEGDTAEYLPVHENYNPDMAGRNTGSQTYNAIGSAEYNDLNDPTATVCEPLDGIPATVPEDPPDNHLPVADCSIPLRLPRCGCSLGVPMFTYDKMRNMLTSSRTLTTVHKVLDWDTYPDGIGSAEEEESTREEEMEYDELYRLREHTIEITDPTWNANGGPIPVERTFSFDYLENGLLEAMTDGDGTITEYGYDDAGRLTRVDVNSATLVQYTLYPTGRIQSATFANGVETEYTYDDAGRVNTIAVTDTGQAELLFSLDYDWTPDGLVSEIAVVAGADSYTVNFEYDLRGRLIREWSTDGPASRDYDLSYTYDQVGNRLTKTDNLADPDIVTTYHYDVHDTDPLENYASFNNRLMSYEVEQDSTVLERTYYAYNRGGHVKRIVTEYPDDDPDYYYVRVLQYNTASQLWLIRGFEIDAECGEENANVTALYAREFRYDGDRARYAVIERDPEDMEPTGATWHEYVGDDIYKDLSISPTTGAVTVDASYAHGYSLASMLNSGGRTYFHGDMLGTTRLITNSSAVAVQSPAFTAFGEPLPLPAAGGPVSQPNLGTRYAYVGGFGYQNDGAASASRDIGMLHVGARYYDPAIGRFIMRDPIGIRGGLNVYAYSNNCPTILADPTGKEFSYAGVLTASALGAFLGGTSNAMSSGVWNWADFGAGAAGGAVGGGLGMINPIAGGAAGNLITGLLSGDRGLDLALDVLLGAGVSWLGSLALESEMVWESAFIAIDTGMGTNICRYFRDNVFR